MYNNSATFCVLHTSIRKFTDIIPNIYFKENSSTFIIAFVQVFPKTTVLVEILDYLKQFGTPVVKYEDNVIYITVPQ